VKNRRQLHVLVAACTWVSLAGLFVLYMERAGEPGPYGWFLWVWRIYPRGIPWFSFFILSVPGLLFGAVMFWWLGNEE
jgi:hypothetical protein